MTLAPRLIGRVAERDALARMVVGGALVTVTGPAGVGKSRLVAELPAPVAAAHLAALAPGSSAATIADALGFESLDAAAVVLGERGGIVLLDCCEHVLGGAREAVAAIHAAAPGTAVVTTSRAPLELPGEQLLVLGPLDPAPAVELFLERAGAAGADLSGTADVAELCRRLDGLPLALELAAARSRAIAPADLLRALDRRLDLLRRRDGRGDRHDSMRAAVEVSTALLDPVERALFDCLGVCSGRFDAGLAAAVAGFDRVEALDVLDALVAQSLLLAEPSAAGTTYRMLELLREHALEALAARGEVAVVQARFVDAMVAVADDIVARALQRWDPAMLGAASVQFANLVRAVELCLANDDTADRAYRLVLPLFAAVHEGRSADVWALGERVRARWDGRGVPWRAEVLAVLATAAAIGGRHDDVGPLAAAVVDDPSSSDVALALADRAWGLATRPADPIAAAEHFALAGAAARRAGFGSMAREVAVFEAGERDLAGDPVRARRLLDDVLAAADREDDVFVAVLALLVRACVALRAGDRDDAQVAVRAAHDRSALVGHPWWRAALARMAAATEALGGAGWEASRPRWRDAVDTAAGAGAIGEVGITLRVAASIADHLGELAVADGLAAAAPRTTSITVLPSLCPPHAVDLATSPPMSITEALTQARHLLGAPQEHVARPADTGELAADGDGWLVSFAGRTTRVRDMKGVRDLAVLLARPGVEVHAIELMGGQDVGDAAGPALDADARRSYQARIVELQREIDEARDDHDIGRADRAEVELDMLVAQLSEAFGLGGRARPTGSSAERARTAVTYRVRAAIRKVADVHPELGRHLTNAVRTGVWCAYRPERDTAWTVTPHDVRGGLTPLGHDEPA